MQVTLPERAVSSEARFLRTRDLLADLISGEAAVGQGVQLWICDSRGEVDITVGAAVPSGAMLPCLLHKVWCATKPCLALLLAGVLERYRIGFEADVGSVLGRHVRGITFLELFRHRADLTRPRLFEVLITPPDRRRAMIEAALAVRLTHPEESGYSEVASWFLMAHAYEALTGETVDEGCSAVLREARCGSDVVLTINTLAEFVKLRDLIGVYVSGRDGGNVRPWLHDRTFAVATTDTSPTLGGYASARGLGRFWRAVLQQLQRDTYSRFPSGSLLSEYLYSAHTYPHEDRILGRKGAYALGCQVSLSDYRLGTKPSARSFGHIGFLGNSFGFADPDADLVIACVANGMPISRGSLERWRTVVVDEIYGER